MKKLTLILSLFCLFQLQAERTSTPFSKKRHQPKSIRVLLEKNVDEALIEVTGSYYIYNPHEAKKISSGILGKRFIVHALDNGLKWGEYFPGIHQFLIVPRSDKTAILVNGVQYKGGIAVYHVENKICIVNNVMIEDYVKATLSPKFQTPIDKEAMAATAIISRTNAYHIVTTNKNAKWHVNAKSENYQGESMVKPNSPIDLAVEDTSHLILTNSDNKPFSTKWTEHCAGKTAPYHLIYRKEGHTPKEVVSSTIAQYNRKDSAWDFEIPKQRLSSLFNISDVKEINPFIDKESGKTYAVQLKSATQEKTLDFFTFQEKIGHELLKSNDFSLSPKGDNIYFKGFGKGDGVGLCLYTAEILSQKGENAVNILKQFYPKSHLVNLSPIPIEENHEIKL